MSDLFDVSRETILITGASQGLGRQFARVLSAHGAAVVLAARQIGKLRALEEEIRGRGGRAAAVELDVTDAKSIGRAVDSAEAALGPVTVLINNAGIAVEKLAVDQTEADWDAVIGAKLKGAYFLATEIARRMAETPPPIPESHTPWEELFREKTGQLDTGAVLETAVKYRGVAARTPRHNH